MLPNGNIPKDPSSLGQDAGRHHTKKRYPPEQARERAGKARPFKDEPAAPSDALSRCAPGYAQHHVLPRTKNHARVFKILGMTTAIMPLE